MKHSPTATEPRRSGHKALNAVTLGVSGALVLCLIAVIYAARRGSATNRPPSELMAEKHRHPVSIHHEVSKPSTVMLDTERTVVAAPAGSRDAVNGDLLRPKVGAPLVRYRPLPPPQELIKDPEFNRFGQTANTKVLRALEKLILETNQRMSDLEVEKVKIAESWARIRIAHGDYKAVSADSAPQAGPPGSFAVTVAEAGDNFAKLVVIHPGEYAELDVIAGDMQYTLKTAHAEIDALLSQKGN